MPRGYTGRRPNAKFRLPGSRSYGYTPAAPPEIRPTTAIAGSPGTFGPEGAVPPETGAALEKLAAEPASAWNEAEYVAAANADERFWDGSAWVAGRVPAPPEPPEQPPA